jgi:hypothetical protein
METIGLDGKINPEYPRSELMSITSILNEPEMRDGERNPKEKLGLAGTSSEV